MSCNILLLSCKLSKFCPSLSLTTVQDIHHIISPDDTNLPTTKDRAYFDLSYRRASRILHGRSRTSLEDVAGRNHGPQTLPNHSRLVRDRGATAARTRNQQPGLESHTIRLGSTNARRIGVTELY